MTKLLREKDTKLYETNRKAKIWNEAKEHYFECQKRKYLAIAKEERKIAYAMRPKKGRSTRKKRSPRKWPRMPREILNYFKKEKE
jgi:hypothetical protein